jgi:cytochrome P450
VTAPIPLDPRLRGPRPLPFLGPRGGLLRFFRDPVGVLLSLRERYGPIAAVSDGDPSLVCLFGPEHNRAVLSDPQRFHNFAEPPFPFPPDSGISRLWNGLTAMNGERHRRHRRLLQPPFQKGTVDGYRDDVVGLAGAILETWPRDGLFDLDEATAVLTLRIAMRVLFGVDVERDARDLGRMAKATLQQLTSVAVMAFPYDLPSTPYSDMLALADRMEARVRALVAEKRMQPVGRDVLSLLVRAHDEDGASLTDSELVGHANVLYVAAHETTAFTLSWTLFLLSQHPTVAADLADEVRGVLRGDAPTVAQIARMPLLDAVLKESMRLLPATPFFFLRRLTGSSQVGPFTLPEGSTLILSPLVTHRDPDLFPEPKRFRPERWQGLTPSPYEYLPFGAGPRLCLGAPFAALVLRLVLPMIVQRSRFRLAWSADVSRRVQGITMGPKHGMPMRVTPQDGWYPRPTRVRGDIHELVDLTARA